MAWSAGRATLQATGGGSGNPVVFTVDSSSTNGACTVTGTNGSTVNYLAAGNCVIDANQAGGNGYAPAGQVRRTIPVTALLTQVISFQAPASGVVGGSATLQASGGGSGNPVVFTVDSSSGAGVCTVTGTNGSTVNYTGAGNCVIDANQAGGGGYAPAGQVRRTTPVLPNLVGNAGFETNLTGWNTSGSDAGVTLTRVAGGHSGSWSAQILNTSNNPSTALLNDSPNWVTTTAAKVYTGTLWVRSDTPKGGQGGILKLRFREYQGQTLVGTATSQITLTTSWQQVS